MEFGNDKKFAQEAFEVPNYSEADILEHMQKMARLYTWISEINPAIHCFVLPDQVMPNVRVR